MPMWYEVSINHINTHIQQYMWDVFMCVCYVNNTHINNTPCNLLWSLQGMDASASCLRMAVCLRIAVLKY